MPFSVHKIVCSSSCQAPSHAALEKKSQGNSVGEHGTSWCGVCLHLYRASIKMSVKHPCRGCVYTVPQCLTFPNN